MRREELQAVDIDDLREARKMSRYAKRKKRVDAIRNGIAPVPKEKFVLPNGIKVIAIFFGIGTIWLYTEVVRALLGHLSEYWASMAESLHKEYLAGWVALLVGVVGYGFYELRRKRRLMYSVVEFSVALMVTTEACLRTKAPTTLAAALMSAIYFVVRAFDNFEKGFQELDTPAKASVPAAPDEIKRSSDSEMRNP